MEQFVLLSQATCLSVVFYVVIYFLISWHWPETLLSVFVCIVVLYCLMRETGRTYQARAIDTNVLVSALRC
jgi:hypothetical protein